MGIVISIDAGTTGVRSFAVDESGSPLGFAYREFTQYFPNRVGSSTTLKRSGRRSSARSPS